MTGRSGGTATPAWHRVAYIVAALPFFLLALVGAEYGGLVFGIPGLLCLAVAVRPVPVAALLLLIPLVVGTLMYGAMLLLDVARLLHGGSPSILLDADDSAVFVAFESLLIAASVLMFLVLRDGVRRGLESK